MNQTKPDWPCQSLAALFTVFVFASAFSISLSQMSALVGLVIFIYLLWRDRFQPVIPQVKWVYVFIGLYLCLLWLSALLGATPSTSLAVTKEEWLFLLIPMATYLLRDEAIRTRLFTALAVGVALFALYGMVQYFTHVSWLRFADGQFSPETVSTVRGTFSHSLTYANYYVTAACFLLGLSLGSGPPKGWRSWLLLIAGVVAFVAMILTLRRGAVVAGAVTLAFFALVVRSRIRWVPVGLVAILLATLVVVPQFRERFGAQTMADQSAEYQGSRLFIWKHSLEIVADHPLFGVGQGNFHDAYSAKLPADALENRRLDHAHNDILNFAVVMGIPGAAVFLGLWLAILIACWRGYRREGRRRSERVLSLAALLGSVAFLISSMSEATFADEEVRQLLMFVWATGLVVWYNDASRSGTPRTDI